MSLTDKECRNAKTADKECKLYDGQGLYLLVTPTGRKYWRLKYKHLGREKKLSFGVYPEVSLAEAREKRDSARKVLAGGKDPAFVKREIKLQAALAAANTFEVVAREWHDRNKDRWTPIYREDILRRMEQDIFPQLGRFPISTITPLQLLKTLQKIEDRGAREMARRALQYCSQVFQYAVITAHCERNPAVDLKGALRPMKHGHYAALDADDLPQFIKDLNSNDTRLYLQTRHALRFMMLTFVRTGELIGAKWPEFYLDAAEWHIPAERMKMKRPHIVPLSRQAIDILNDLKRINGKREWVFASPAKPRQHMSNNTILAALERLGYRGRMTGHGFRALAMSAIKEKLGYRHEVVDRQLAHAPANKVDAAYDRAKFLPERRMMMQDWADYLDGVATGSNVIKVNFGKV